MHRSIRAVKRIRHTFYAGRLRPIREPKPCSHGWHTGRPLDAAKFDAAGGIWRGQATCSSCGSTVHRSQFARVA